MKATAPPLAAKRTSLFGNRNFWWLWSGQIISSAGDTIFDTTLVLWVAASIVRTQPWAPLALSGLLFAEALPVLLCGLLAGSVADRWDRRRIMLAMDACRATLTGVMALAAVLLPYFPRVPSEPFWELGGIYFFVFCNSTCTQFFIPARFALQGEIIAEDERTRASGLLQSTNNFAMMLGAPLASLLFVVLGVQLALILNALSFVVSFLSIWQVAPPQQVQSTTSPTPHSSFWKEFNEGLHFFAQSSVLRALLITMCTVLFCGGITATVSYFFAIQELTIPLSLYGLLGVASGAGLLLGALFTSWIGQRVKPERLFWGGTILIGLTGLLYARQTSFIPALLILFVQGLPNAAMNVALGPLVLKVTPGPLMGRVWGLLVPAMNLTMVISTLLAGLTTSLLPPFHVSLWGLTFRPFDTTLTIAGLLMLGAGLYAFKALYKFRDVIPAEVE